MGVLNYFLRIFDEVPGVPKALYQMSVLSGYVQGTAWHARWVAQNRLVVLSTHQSAETLCGQTHAGDDLRAL